MRIANYFNHPLCDIYYESIGEGFPIIHIHGYELNLLSIKNSMEDVYHSLKNIKRIYFDLPGMGKSVLKGRINSAETMLSCVKDLIQFLIADQKYALVGLSYGAYLARYLINDVKDPSISGMMICPVIKPNYSERIIPPFRIASLDKDFIKQLSQECYSDIKDWLVVQTPKVYDYLQKEIYVGTNECQKDFIASYQKDSYAFKKDIDIVKKPIEKHCVFICGKEDVIVGYQDCFNILANYDNADFHLISGAGHFLNREQENKFRRLARNWLKEICI